MANGSLERLIGPLSHLHPRKELVIRPEQQLYTAALGLTRDWDIFEKGKIIDFDLNGPSRGERALTAMYRRPTKRGRGEIIEGFTELLGQAEKIKPPPGESHNWQFFLTQLEASLCFAKRLRGDRLRPLEFIKNTQGVEPEEIPEEALEHQKQVVLELFGENGIGQPSEQALVEFKEQNLIDPDTAQRLLKEFSNDAINAVGRILDKPLNFPFNVAPILRNAYFFVWADTDSETGGFVLQLNFWQNGRPKIWTIGKTEELGPHEGGEHLARMAIRRELIKEGRLHPYFGLTNVHGPEPLIDEGLAQTLVHFIPELYAKMSSEGKLQVELTILRNMVYSNVHLRVNGDSRPGDEEVIEYVRSYLPWEPIQDILQEIKDRTTDPLLQTYRLSYGMGAYRHLLYASVLNNEGKRQYLRSIYSGVYTGFQADELVMRLSRDRRYQNSKALRSLPGFRRPPYADAAGKAG